MRNLFPRALRRTLTLCLALLCLVSAVSCGKNVHTMTSQDGGYFDKWTDVTYIALPAAYQPISRGEEYGKVNLSGMTNLLYEVVGLPNTSYLCTAYGDVYYDKTITPILFEEWVIETMQVCTDRSIIVSNLTLTPADAVHDHIIDSYRTAWLEALAVRYPSYLTPARHYTLRFTSPTAPGLYYAIQLLEYGEDVYTGTTDAEGNEIEINLGRCFLYDRYSGRCVPVDDRVFRLLDGEEVKLPTEEPTA